MSLFGERGCGHGRLAWPLGVGDDGSRAAEADVVEAWRPRQWSGGGQPFSTSLVRASGAVRSSPREVLVAGLKLYWV
jgi:hypothetical protein